MLFWLQSTSGCARRTDGHPPGSLWLSLPQGRGLHAIPPCSELVRPVAGSGGAGRRMALGGAFFSTVPAQRGGHSHTPAWCAGPVQPCSALSQLAGRHTPSAWPVLSLPTVDGRLPFPFPTVPVSCAGDVHAEGHPSPSALSLTTAAVISAAYHWPEMCSAPCVPFLIRPPANLCVTSCYHPHFTPGETEAKRIDVMWLVEPGPSFHGDPTRPDTCQH